MTTLAKWSVEDYHRMVEAGILHGRHVELLAGEIVEMSPETPIHYTTAKRGAKYLEALLAPLAFAGISVSVQRLLSGIV
jgi:Uma2 family endonuclease